MVEALSKLDIGTVIPRELYAVVAEVLAFVYSVDAEAAALRRADPCQWFDKLKASVTRSRDALLGLETMALARRPLDAAFWQEFEEILIGADFGFATTEKIVSALVRASRNRTAIRPAIKSSRASSAT